MTACRIVRVVGVASLVLLTGSLGRGLNAKAEAKAMDAPDSGEIVFVESGQAFDEALSTHAFVVLRRADGRVPRGYLWDEPLGCPASHAE